MDYLLDTSSSSQVLKGHQAVVQRLKSLPLGDRVFSSVITEGELLYGAARMGRARRGEYVEEVSLHLADMADVLSITRSVAVSYAQLRHRLDVLGRPVPVNDLWIAAIANSGDFTLVAHDEHFGRIEGLKLVDWLEA